MGINAIVLMVSFVLRFQRLEVWTTFFDDDPPYPSWVLQHQQTCNMLYPPSLPDPPSANDPSVYQHY